MHNLERWSDIRKLLERPGKITGAGFEPDPAILDFLQDDARVLVVGAGASHWPNGMQAKPATPVPKAKNALCRLA